MLVAVHGMVGCTWMETEKAQGKYSRIVDRHVRCIVVGMNMIILPHIRIDTDIIEDAGAETVDPFFIAVRMMRPVVGNTHRHQEHIKMPGYLYQDKAPALQPVGQDNDIQQYPQGK